MGGVGRAWPAPTHTRLCRSAAGSQVLHGDQPEHPAAAGGMAFAVRARELCHPRCVIHSAAMLIGGSNLSRSGSRLCLHSTASLRSWRLERSGLRESAGTASATGPPAVCESGQPPPAESNGLTTALVPRTIEPWEHLSPAGMSEENCLLHALGWTAHTHAPMYPDGYNGGAAPVGLPDVGRLEAWALHGVPWPVCAPGVDRAPVDCSTHWKRMHAHMLQMIHVPSASSRSFSSRQAAPQCAFFPRKSALRVKR
eukprot:jgi/Ulvmu1/7848/UM004_0079.1